MGKGYGALLPSGTVAGASASAAKPSGSGSAGGLHPAGGGTIASLSSQVSVADNGPQDGTASAQVSVSGVTLFDGRVSFDRLELSAEVTASAAGPQVSVDGPHVSGLVVNGTPVAAGPGDRIPVEGIGTLIFLERNDTADGVSVNALRVEISDPNAQALIGGPFVLGHLELGAAADPVDELPAGTVETPQPPPASTAPGSTSTTATPPPSVRRPRDRFPVRTGPREPSSSVAGGGDTPSVLTAPEPTPLAPLPRREAPAGPPILGDGYLFPVFGDVWYGDDWMAARAGTGTHHGNDLFADRGTPVIAVADGVLSKVGVNTLGGNRLWLADDNGVWFYYAHLSAYAPATVDGARVTRGQVIAFVGNTGQAITTPPHLHFEIHPGGLDAPAINPYPFLTRWERGEAAPLTPDPAGGGADAASMRAIGAVIVDGIPEEDRSGGEDDGLARAVY